MSSILQIQPKEERTVYAAKPTDSQRTSPPKSLSCMHTALMFAVRIAACIIILSSSLIRKSWQRIAERLSNDLPLLRLSHDELSIYAVVQLLRTKFSLHQNAQDG